MNQTEVFTPDTNALKKFIDSFDFNLITVSVIPQREDGFVPHGNYFSVQNKIRAVTPSIFFSDEFQEELRRAQFRGCAIYFTINEGDGVPTNIEEGNLNCGKRTNIKTLKTLAIDTDEANANDLMSVLKDLRLLPHYMVQSSPGKFHFYFMIEPTPAVGDHILQWKALQKKLASLIPLLDQSMADINQVLRIPTFFNLKDALGEPYLVNIFRKADHNLYNLKNLYDRLEAHTMNDFDFSTVSTSGSTTYNKFEFPKQMQSIPSGERRNKICSFIEHVMENVVPITAKDEDFFVHIDAFIIKYLKPQDVQEFLPGGKRRRNIEQYFYDQRNYRLRKHQALESREAVKQFEHQVAVEETSLPDDFYLNFPGDLGMITREVHNFSENTSLELCFAAALAISGALKAELLRFKGAWPMVNGLVIAGTGAGKSTFKGVVEKALQYAGLRGKYPQFFGFQNTVQSLHTSLYTAGGVGSVIVDESGDYLQSITAKNAPSYAKNLKKYFKEATTGREHGTWLHPGGSLSYNVPPIDGGFLAIWMLIQPDKFAASLNLDDMSDGFLPRFFIFNGKSQVHLTRMIDSNDGAIEFSPSLDFRVWMDSLTSNLPYSSDVQLTELLKQTETEALANNAKTKPETIRLMQRDAVYNTRSTSRRMNIIKVRIEDEGMTKLKLYLTEREKAAKAIAKNSDIDPSLGIFIRMEEMMMRLLCNAVSVNNNQATITTNLAEAAIQFHRFQTDRFFEKELKEMSQGDGEKDWQTVLKGLKKAFKTKGEAVRMKEVCHAIAGTQRPKNISAVMKELISRGEVWVQEREHAKAKGRKVVLYMPALSEDIID